MSLSSPDSAVRMQAVLQTCRHLKVANTLVSALPPRQIYQPPTVPHQV